MGHSDSGLGCQAKLCLSAAALHETHKRTQGHTMTDLKTSIDVATDLVSQAKHLVVFSGAGISTESGLPDYRGPDGVWTRRDQGLPPPRGTPMRQAQPNSGHRALVLLQRLGKLGFLISQNVDNLHLASGIRPELLAELHGNVARVRCAKCERTYPLPAPPRRCVCGCKVMRSSVINFGDTLPEAIAKCDWESGFLWG